MSVIKNYIYNPQKEFLIKMSDGTSFLNENEKAKLVPQQLCIGKRKITDVINDGSIEDLLAEYA